MKNNILDEILNNKKEDSLLREEDKVLLPLLEEIEFIKDENIKSFVRSILYRAKDFWLMPASFSGKHHPPDERSVGGNVIHTQRVVRAAKILSESYSLSEEDKDLVYAACLLHDITKGIMISENEGYVYDPMHPYTVGHFVLMCQEEDKKYASESQSSTLFLSEEVVQSILRLVRCHLGPWSPVPETAPITYLDMIVHMADNIASKMHKIIDGENVIMERWEHE
jgi:23S rRNA maturation-related 3'-5' exoribonuclease YhaM